MDDPLAGAAATAWPLRAADVDVLGHVNNSAYWQALEEVVARDGDWQGRLRAILEHRRPIDLDEPVELRRRSDGRSFTVAFSVHGTVRAIAAATAT